MALLCLVQDMFLCYEEIAALFLKSVQDSCFEPLPPPTGKSIKFFQCSSFPCHGYKTPQLTYIVLEF